MRCVLLLWMALLSCNLYAAEIELVNDGFSISAVDWPWWRGPMRNGTAAEQQDPPTKFSSGENVLWKTAVPGRGHSSPTVYGDRIFLTTGDDQQGSQSVLCYSRQTGELLWETVVHASGSMQRNGKASAASSTVACDGERVIACFPNDNALWTTALDLDGKQLWQTRISSYVVHQGYGSSPALYQDLVIVTSDNKGGGAIAALHRQSGEVVWKRERPEKPNYPSPIILSNGGKDQIVLVGCDQIVSYDPLTGETNWETEGATTECVTSTLTDGRHVYTSGGYPTNHMSAIAADGSAKLAWRNDSRLYVPSMVIKDGFLYGVLDAGIATCWKADTGEVMWKGRLGGTFSSSPVLVGDRIYVCNEAGEMFVLRARSDAFEEIAKSELGEQVFATPTIVAGKIYHRVTQVDKAGTRQEWLYCLGR